jgi:hypothetical protein
MGYYRYRCSPAVTSTQTRQPDMGEENGAFLKMFFRRTFQINNLSDQKSPQI